MLLLSLAATAAPSVFNASPSARPGDIVNLQGSGFGTAPKIWLAAGNGPAVEITPLNNGNGTLAFRVPSTQPLAMYSLLVRSGGDSNVVRLNKAWAMHFDTPEIASGGTFRVFGRNLLLQGFSPTVRFVNPSTGASANASVVSSGSDAYVLNVQAPSGLSVGTRYDVYVKNGSSENGDSGEVKAGRQLLARAAGSDVYGLGVPWAADYNFTSNVYNVKTDSRLSTKAVGDGVADDGPAINAALAKAAADGGGVVYLPQGSFACKSSLPLLIKSRVVLQGAGKDSTEVRYGYGNPTSGGGGYGVYWNDNASVAGISDLTLNNYNATGNWRDNMTTGPGCSKLFINRTRLLMSTCDQLYLSGSQWVITNSIFDQGVTSSVGYQGIMTMAGNRDYVIRGNQMTHVVGQAISLDSTNNGVVENNKFSSNAGLKPAGIEQRQLNLNFTTNIALLGNTFEVFNGTARDDNDGESILSEGGGGNRVDQSVGTLTGGSGTTVTDSSRNFSGGFSSSPVIYIVSGPGAGQSQSITGGSGGNLSVGSNWAVAPGAGARYAIFNWSATNWLVRGNTFNQTKRGIWLYTGASRDVALVNNTFNNGEGIYLRPQQNLATSYADGSPKAADFTVIQNVQVVGNTLTGSGARPAYIAVLMVQVSFDQTLGVGAIGVEVRNNSIAGSGAINYDSTELGVDGYINYLRNQYSSYTDTGTPGVLGTIFQGNTFSGNSAAGSGKAYLLSSGSYQTTIAGATASQIKDDVIPGTNHSSVGTVVLP